MTHKDAGNYGKKRKGTKLNENIANYIKEKTINNEISCEDAHKIAEELNVNPNEVGANIDLLEVRIVKCQLGLFGYENKKNIPTLPERINPDIELAIKSCLINNKLPCKDAWEIAKKFNIKKAMVTAICESMNIKISACQLGAF